MTDFELIKKRMDLIEEKSRNSFSEVKRDNDELKRGISELSKFMERNVSREDLKREVEKKLMDIIEKRLDAINKEMKSNFARNSKKIKDIENSTLLAIADQNKLIDLYASKIEAYSAELENDYNKSKKDILSSCERKTRVLKNETMRLQRQVSYLNGRINNALGKEETTREGRGFFKKMISSFSSK